MRIVKIARLDFYALKNQRGLAAVYALLPVFFFLFGGHASIACWGSMTVICLNSMSTLFSLDSKTDRRRFHASLPATGRDAVCGRYLFLLLHLAVAALFVWLLCTLLVLVWEPLRLLAPARSDVVYSSVSAAIHDNLSSMYATLSIPFTFCYLLMAVQVPLYYRFPYEKARVFTLLSTLAFVALPLFSMPLIAAISNGYFSTTYALFHLQYPSPLVSLALHTLLVLPWLFLSLLLSVRIYRTSSPASVCA